MTHNDEKEQYKQRLADLSYKIRTKAEQLEFKDKNEAYYHDIVKEIASITESFLKNS